jgi:diguanylate cyclase (GGDEF)-like protein
MATAPAVVALVRMLGLLGVAAAVVGGSTLPLLARSDQAWLLDSALVVALFVGVALLIIPARVIGTGLAGAAIIGAIALETVFAALTGGIGSPYRAGFVAIALLVAFFARPVLALTTALTGIACLIVAGALYRPLSSSDVVVIVTVALLTIMVAVSAAQLAAWQRDEYRRLQRRIQRTHVAMQARRTESLTDPLTGAGNRRGFERRIRDLLAIGRVGGRDVLVVADVDGLKRINDTYGHAAGDRAIKAVADALRGLVRSNDEVFRVGGDEFAAVFTDIDAKALARRLPVRVGADVPGVGLVQASIGLVNVEPFDTVGSLVGRADEQMYRVKRPRTNGVQDGSS